MASLKKRNKASERMIIEEMMGKLEEWKKIFYINTFSLISLIIYILESGPIKNLDTSTADFYDVCEFHLE